MKRTSLYETHKADGATLVPFAGWEMPVSYAGTVAEVAATRTSAGLFDVSHMGEVTVKGAGAFDFVQSITTNDVSKLVPGMAQYSLLLNEAGGIIDDILVYCKGENDYFIVLNAGCMDKDWLWLRQQFQRNSLVKSKGREWVRERIKDNQDLTTNLNDISDQTALIAVQGPKSVDLVGLFVKDAKHVDRFHFVETDLGAIPHWHTSNLSVQTVPITLSRTGYTGEDGFEVFCRWEDAEFVWNALAAAGAIPAGLGARDVLRLEAAYSLYGHELDAETVPQESGVGWAVKMKKGEFVGRKALQENAPTQQIVGLQMDARAIPREHYIISDAKGQVIGETTSGTWSPTVKAGIAMARVNLSAAAPGTPVFVDIRGRQVPATITKLPFYRNGV